MCVFLNIFGFFVESDGSAKDFGAAEARSVAQAVQLISELLGHAYVESLAVKKGHGVVVRAGSTVLLDLLVP